jgi:hypothetical protein
MPKLPINTPIAMTFNTYFNDARDDDIETCKDDTIKKARDKITYMAETINGNIETSTDMVTTSSKLKDLIIDYNNFINDSSNVKDWSSGHENILKLTGKYSTLLSKLIIHDEKLKRMCDEKMKQHPLKPILEYFDTLKQKTNHFYLPTYVVLKLLRYRDLTFEATKHAEGLQHNIKLNTVLQVNSSQRNKSVKLFKNFFKFITTNFKISIQNDATLNQTIYLSNTPADITSIDQYIETMESLLKYFKQNNIPTSASLAKAILTENEVKTYENIRKHFEFINERAFALGKYFNLILISQKKPGKQGDHLKVSTFKKFIRTVRKKLKGGIQSTYKPLSPTGVGRFENPLVYSELPTQHRQFDKKLNDRNGKRGPYIPKPTRIAPSRPPTYNPETIRRDYSDREARRATGTTKPLPPTSSSSSTLPSINLSSLDEYSEGPSFEERNKQVSRRTRERTFNNGSNKKGGNKTRKKKRKKRNTTRNKKRHKKKKHKTRYKKRKKMKQTRKNK